MAPAPQVAGSICVPVPGCSCSLQRMFQKGSFSGSYWVWGLGAPARQAVLHMGFPHRSWGWGARLCHRWLNFMDWGRESVTMLALCPYPARHSLPSHLRKTSQSFLAGGHCATNRPRVPAWECAVERFRAPCTWAWCEGHATRYTARLRGREKVLSRLSGGSPSPCVREEAARSAWQAAHHGP